jgi:predicted SprT family Zn-dependent metalloprotease
VPDHGAAAPRRPAASGSRDGTEVHDEIAFNIRLFAKRSPGEILATLVHEMCHLEQAHFGAPSRNGYHNREWATLMERVGLVPSDTGRPGASAPDSG